MKKNLKIIKKEDGQALVLLAFALIALMGIAALVVDLGRGYLTKSKLQNIADAAALAAAQDLPEISEAIETAINFAAKNGFIVTESGVESSGNIVTVTTPYEGDITKIQVTCTKTINYTFAKIFGHNEQQISAKAVAQYGIANSVPWIVPFVIAEPPQFNYDEVYVMRMYGAGPYPYDYNYPSNYRNHSAYRSYSIDNSSKLYKAADNIGLRAEAKDRSQFLVTIPKNTVLSSITNYNTTWLKVTFNNRTGYVKKDEVIFENSKSYPYQFDYMNVYIKNNTGFSEYVHWLENGYHDEFQVGERMFYYAPSSGGQPSVDAFAKRVQRDRNTDYRKAKVGDDRVILIPIVDSMLSRDTRDKTPITIKGFTAFYIQNVYKNSYGTSFWFEGRFLKNVIVNSDDITFDTSADYGLRVLRLVK